MVLEEQSNVETKALRGTTAESQVISHFFHFDFSSSVAGDLSQNKDRTLCSSASSFSLFLQRIFPPFCMCDEASVWKERSFLCLGGNVLALAAFYDFVFVSEI